MLPIACQAVHERHLVSPSEPLARVRTVDCLEHREVVFFAVERISTPCARDHRCVRVGGERSGAAALRGRCVFDASREWDSPPEPPAGERVIVSAKPLRLRQRQ